MPREYTFLSFPLCLDSPNPPAIPRMELTPFMSLKSGQEANVTTIKVVTHTGTHVDAPCHVIEAGITLTDFLAEELIFHRPVLFDLRLEDAAIVQPEHLHPYVEAGKEADLVLFRFGYGSVRRMDPQRYSLKCPGFGVESAGFLRDHFPRMRALGMDVPSLACIESLDKTMAAHHVLLGGEGRRFLVIEDMDLEKDLSRLETVTVAPWFIKNMDGGPAMIIGALG